jgi:hypothetical protein
VLTTPTWTVPDYKEREQNYHNNINVDQGKHNNAEELRGQGRLWLIYLQNITNCCLFVTLLFFLLLLFPFWEGVPPVIRSRWLGMPSLHLPLRSGVLQSVLQTCDCAEGDVYSHKSLRSKDVCVYIKAFVINSYSTYFTHYSSLQASQNLFIVSHIQSPHNSYKTKETKLRGL